MPKPFVAPGRRAPAPPEQAQAPPPPPPVLELVHADPVVSNLKSTLVLPPTPPPQMDPRPPKVAAEAPPQTTGDPVNILSLNDRPVPATDKLVVPPGNVAGRLGDEAGTGTGGTAITSTAITSAKGTPDKTADSASSNAAAGTKSGAGTEVASNRSSSGPGGVATGNGATPGSGSATGSGANAGRGAGVPGGVTILGGGAARPSTSPVSPVIIRPANGNFDAVVVQTATLDQFPESKGLLNGRPIYTVFISVGTSKDWAMYFCLPSDKASPAPKGNVIDLGSTAAPVQAPYPTRLVRPDVAVPAYYKYVLVHGYVNATGRFEGLRVVRSTRPETDEAIVASLSGWEFRAATKDGIKVAVEFLLSIPVSGL